VCVSIKILKVGADYGGIQSVSLEEINALSSVMLFHLSAAIVFLSNGLFWSNTENIFRYYQYYGTDNLFILLIRKVFFELLLLTDTNLIKLIFLTR